MATLLTKKTINNMGMQINENKGSKISDFAQNYMKKLGWSEGKGLGKEEKGIDTHIKVKKKDESSGLGLDQVVQEQRVASEQWWHDGFSQSLKAFGAKNKKAKKNKKRKHDADDEDDDDDNVVGNKGMPSYEELFRATGGARLGMRARGSQNGKFLRTEHNSEVIKLSIRTRADENEIVASQMVEETSGAAEKAVREEEDDEEVHSKKSKKDKRDKENKKDKKDKKVKKVKKDKKDKDDE